MSEVRAAVTVRILKRIRSLQAWRVDAAADAAHTQALPLPDEPGTASTEKALKDGLRYYAHQLECNSARDEVARRVLGVSCFRRRLAWLVGLAGGDDGALPWLLLAYVLLEEARWLEQSGRTPLLPAAVTLGPSMAAPDAAVLAAAVLGPGHSTAAVAALAGLSTDTVAWPNLQTELSMPDWIVHLWTAELGAGQTRALASASNLPGQICVRVNILRVPGGRNTLARSLAQSGITTTPCRFSPWGLNITAPRKPNIWALEQWKRGEFEVMDEGSQLIALAAVGDVAAGAHAPVVVDMCAGKGGKALAMAMANGDGGVVVAYDIDETFLQAMRGRLPRSNCVARCAFTAAPTPKSVADAVWQLRHSPPSVKRGKRQPPTIPAPVPAADADADAAAPGTGSFRCSVCSFGFERESHLAAHMSAHDGTRPHLCGVCGKSFAEEQVLRRHAQAHGAAVAAPEAVAAAVRDSAAGGPREDRQPMLVDVVLVDVPCSRLGILRRGPGTRWELSQSRVAELPDVQMEILRTAAALVKVGGLVVYATCTLRAAENEAVLARFEAESCRPGSPHFEPAPLADAWRSHMDPGTIAELQSCGTTSTSTHMQQLLPSKHRTDGFFIARYRRTADV